uniref:DNA ligase n=1 Tax=Mycena chlorophos TaxID=658473 RepID=A0ABQ0L8E1_MYCCL|nr:DNA ligase 4 [Mycena chlorophos]
MATPPPPVATTTVTYPVPPGNVASAPFSVLTALFERLSQEKKQDVRRKLIAGWFNHWRTEKGLDLYPVLRLLLPQKDRERPVYGLKEKNLAKAYIKIITLGSNDRDAIRLLNWKKPTEQNKASGDFPTVLYDVVQKRSSVIEGSLSIDELNGILDDLAKNSKNTQDQQRILQRVYDCATPNEQRWIARIILKDMVISVKETTVFSVFHPDAHDLYNTCSDLKQVAWTLHEPEVRLHSEDKAVKLFAAFAPMLCKRPMKSISETVAEMKGAEFYIEEKLDGERMQLHKRGSEYFYCSRKGKDYTYLYGKHVGTGSLTPYIDKAFDPRVDEIILDGEMLVWDPVSQRNLPFGTLKTAALDRSKKEAHPRPCFKVFDVLFLNGKSLLTLALSERKRNLKALMRPVKGRFEFTTEYRGKTTDDIKMRLEQVMEDRGEGLVIKHPNAQYILNGRNNDWIKVKPEYMDNLGETVDVLVVGGNYGSGHRSGGVSTLICAVLDDKHQSADPDEEPRYRSFVRIGSGLSFGDYVWVRSLKWKPWDPKKPPKFLLTAENSHDDKGDVYILPEDSFILKVKAAQITESEQYHMKYTMRFPRALSIREDLTVADCMTASGVLESVRTIKKRKMESEEVSTTGNAKKKRKIAKKAKVEILAAHGKGTGRVEVKSDLLEGLTFVIQPNNKSPTFMKDKDELQKLIKKHGGTLAQSFKNYRDEGAWIMVYAGTTKTPPINTVINEDRFDIITPQWIHDSIAEGEPVPLLKKYFFHATTERAKQEDYNLDEDDVTEDDEDPPMQASKPAEPKNEIKDEDEQADDHVKVEELDPVLQDWFKAEDNEIPVRGFAEPNDIENDSDNDDVNEPGEVDVADWLGDSDLKLDSKPLTSEDAKVEDEVTEDVNMGDSPTAMEYDQELIFRHLYFYLDSPQNAAKNEMKLKATLTDKVKDAIDQSMADIASIIEKNGGKVVALDDPKLTHVVLDKRDTTRRGELGKRTSKPKRRNLVVAEWIEVCLEERTLLDEDDYKP